MFRMRRPTLLALTLAFSVLGIADSWYLASHEITNTALSCGVGGAALSGCNIVAQSEYAHMFGIPLGVYGVVFYALVLLVTLFLYARPSRRFSQILLALGTIGLLFSIYFEALQIFVIKALCIYCLGSFILSLGIFATAYVLLPKRQKPPLM